MSMPTAEMRLTISSLLSTFSGRAFSTFNTLPRSGRIAWYMRSRPLSARPPADPPPPRPPSRLALDQEQLRLVPIPAGAVHQLAGQAARIEDALAILQLLFR